MMKSFKVKFGKFIALFLALVMLVGVLPVQVVASAATKLNSVPDNESTADSITVEEQYVEVEEAREKYTKVYKRFDNNYTALVSKSPIHYESDGKWVDFDNSLKSDILTLSTDSDNPFNVSFPKKLKENKPIKLENNGKKIEFSIKNIETSKAEYSEKALKADKKMKEAEQALAMLNSTVTYKNIMNGPDLEYTVSSDSIKENIIIAEKDAVCEFYSFSIKAPDLTAAKLESGDVQFIDETNTVFFTIPAPFMTDSNNKLSKNIGVELLKEENETYTLNYSPSREWLMSEERAYPVTIDPIFAAYTDGWLRDGSVVSDKPDEVISDSVAECVGSAYDASIGEMTYNAEAYYQLDLARFRF